MQLFRGVVAELRSARHDAFSPLFRGLHDRMMAAMVQVMGVCVCVPLFSEGVNDWNSGHLLQ